MRRWGYAWTEEEVQTAVRLRKDGLLYKAIGQRLGRSDAAVREKLGRRRLKPRRLRVSVHLRIRKDLMEWVEGIVRETGKRTAVVLEEALDAKREQETTGGRGRGAGGEVGEGGKKGASGKVYDEHEQRAAERVS